MARYAAFLRGINLGKSRRVKSADLCAACEAVGMSDAAAFRASGNLVFEAPRDSGGEPALRGRLEAGLAEALGIEVVVFLRSARQLRAIAAHRPFDPPRAMEGKLQVALLQEKPGAASRRKALAMASAADPIAIRGRELYWWPSGRMADSELDLKELERTVGEWTMRTMGTIEQLAAKYFD